MDSRSSTESRRTLLPAIVGVVLATLVLLSSWHGAALFLTVVCLVALAAALDLSTLLVSKGIHVSRVLIALGVLSLPLVAYWKGESRLGLAFGLVVMGVAAVYVVRGLHPDTLRTVSATIFSALYIGLLAAFTILVRIYEGGDLLLWAFALNFAGYVLGSWVGRSGLGGRAVMPSIGPAPTWWGVLFGLVGSLLGSLFSLTFMTSPFVTSTAVSLALIVTIAALLGDLANRMLRRDLGVGDLQAAVPGMGGIISLMDTLMIAVPAFYYGFRLYLT